MHSSQAETASKASAVLLRATRPWLCQDAVSWISNATLLIGTDTLSEMMLRAAVFGVPNKTCMTGIHIRREMQRVWRRCECVLNRRKHGAFAWGKQAWIQNMQPHSCYICSGTVRFSMVPSSSLDQYELRIQGIVGDVSLQHDI